jgi:hypothetical protein
MVTGKLEGLRAMVGSGAVSGRLPGASEGQLPMLLWMTFHCEFWVGSGSVVMENWHEPPP